MPVIGDYKDKTIPGNQNIVSPGGIITFFHIVPAGEQGGLWSDGLLDEI